MKNKILSVVLPLVGAFSSVSNATIEHEKFSLEIIDRQFDCEMSEIRVQDSVLGGTLIRADFFSGEMLAAIFAGDSSTYAKKTCEIDYMITAKPGYKLSSISFSINGNYLVSAGSHNSARVRHRVNNSVESYGNQQTFSGRGMPRDGVFDNVIATVSGDKLGATCEGQTHIETSLVTDVLRPPQDMDSTAFTNLDQGQGSFDISHVHFVRC